LGKKTKRKESDVTGRVDGERKGKFSPGQIPPEMKSKWTLEISRKKKGRKGGKFGQIQIERGRGNHCSGRGSKAATTGNLGFRACIIRIGRRDFWKWRDKR